MAATNYLVILKASNNHQDKAGDYTAIIAFAGMAIAALVITVISAIFLKWRKCCSSEQNETDEELGDQKDGEGPTITNGLVSGGVDKLVLMM